MSKTHKGPSRTGVREADATRFPQPVNVVDGIPDRRERSGRWRYVLIAVVFALWLAFLIYCAAAGNV